MQIFRRILYTLALAAVALPASAQKLTPKKISFEGVTASQAELLAVSGLKPGVTLSHDDVQAAAQKLMDTGLFGDIQFKYDGIDLHYVLTPGTEAQPVQYANFAWWDEPSLDTAVAAKVPLFHGSLPLESSLQQPVADALTALLSEKGVHATVTATPTQDAAGKYTGVQYHIDAPPVVIGAVTFAGASAAWAEPVAEIQKAAAGQNYDGAAEATLATALRAIYHRQGYLEMSMNGFAHGEPQVVDGKVLIPVSASIVEGAQYKVTSLTLAGGGAMTPEEFAKAAKLHPGDVANEDLLHGTLALVSTAYKTHGYLRAKIDAAPKFDPAAHTVAYAVTVEPGLVFRMGEISLINLSDQQRAEVLHYWPMQEGEVYDATVAPTFLLKNKANLHSLDGWSATWKAYEHDDSQVVDLVVTFRKGGVLQ
jgi:outer membrane protein assembly factor BamA